ncbi:MAG: thiamine-phosphate kinase [Candidatus Methanoplasma sp.]|jgi:thiamine-monophosphate kinase|nr:thiamine-phosphate kinase [Candidatus Methanoplasma sp.]
MASLKDVGERALIRNIIDMIRPGPFVGPGDDAAVVRIEDGRIVAGTDMVSFERHFPSGMTYEQFGWTAAAVNFSDMAGMGARPIGLLASFAMPGDMDESSLYEMVGGMDRCAEHCGTHIIGGDTKPGPGIIVGTALGSLDGRAPLLRSGARPGDMVAVTGRLGGAAAAFAALENGMEGCSLQPLLAPIPRVKEGIALSSLWAATSCMDLSDGLAEAAGSICRASGVGMEIRMEFIPAGGDVPKICSETNLSYTDALLYWGGDYELLFTFGRERLSELHSVGLDFSVIGAVTDGNGPYVTDGEERTVMKNARY